MTTRIHTTPAGHYSVWHEERTKRTREHYEICDTKGTVVDNLDADAFDARTRITAWADQADARREAALAYQGTATPRQVAYALKLRDDLREKITRPFDPAVRFCFFATEIREDDPADTDAAIAAWQARRAELAQSKVEAMSDRAMSAYIDAVKAVLEPGRIDR